MRTSRSKTIVMGHPEFWLGGAERLLLYMANILQQRGHTICIRTTLIDSYWYQHPLLKKLDYKIEAPPFMAGDSYNEMLWIALRMLQGGQLPDVFLCDTSAAPFPLLKLLKPKMKLLFYCHHPHQLMIPEYLMEMWLYKQYVKLFESFCISFADLVLANSDYTVEQFSLLMPDFPRHKLKVLYPCIEEPSIQFEAPRHRQKGLFFTLNRFWPEKKFELLIQAVAHLKLLISERLWRQLIVVIAGSCDNQFAMTHQMWRNLRKLTDILGLSETILFLRRPSDRVKTELLRASQALIYTPDAEHFGMVPVESLAVGTPVIACGTGGPSKTVTHGTTGFVVGSNSPLGFAYAMREFVLNHSKSDSMAAACRSQYLQKYSTEVFADLLCDQFNDMFC